MARAIQVSTPFAVERGTIGAALAMTVVPVNSPTANIDYNILQTVYKDGLDVGKKYPGSQLDFHRDILRRFRNFGVRV